MKIIKIPSSLGGLSKKGSKQAPDKIMEMFNGLYKNNLLKKYIKFTLDEVKPTESNLDKTNKDITKKAKQQKRFTIYLGGDHSITYPILKATADKNTFLIILDAHPDTENPTKSPSHEDYLRVLIDKKIIKPQNIILLGIRKASNKEKQYLKTNKILYFTTNELRKNLFEITRELIKSAKSFKKVYLSLDIDILDPEFAPGTGHPVKAGLAPQELIFLLKEISKLKNLKAVDIVEVDPIKDYKNMTSKAAANIITYLAR